MGRGTRKGRTGRLRIVAGNWRSRLLDIADVPELRPTAERIRETLFNWLATELHGKRCLDLFAGTGALGLEALSRGAAEVVFVERAPAAVDMLRRNVATLGASGATVLQADAFDYLQAVDSGSFDIVFLDPPFADDALSEVCGLLQQHNRLADGGFVYLEQDRARPAPALPPVWNVLKDKTAGNVRYMLIQHEALQE